ncbi:MAG: hypothetical protein CM15mP74_20280 [Halieaceae bacterium]|nr:MAG: hypothetical protein CM15mP74_20280 [Halieaceae bacterium]
MRAWLSPALPTYQLSELERVASDELLNPEIGCQVLLPEAQVLVTRMTLPASAEIFLERGGRRPRHFSQPLYGRGNVLGKQNSRSQRRCSGGRDNYRGAQYRGSRCDGGAPGVYSAKVPFGLSANTDRACVALNGYQDAALDAPYLANLKQYLLRLGALSRALSSLLSSP